MKEQEKAVIEFDENEELFWEKVVLWEKAWELLSFLPDEEIVKIIRILFDNSIYSDQEINYDEGELSPAGEMFIYLYANWDLN